MPARTMVEGRMQIYEKDEWVHDEDGQRTFEAVRMKFAGFVGTLTEEEKNFLPFVINPASDGSKED